MRLLMIGFGHVGQELARILARRNRLHPRLSRVDWKVVGITTASRGAQVAVEGVDLDRALGEIQRAGRFSAGGPQFSDISSDAAVRTLDYDVLLELSTLRIEERGEPAVSLVRSALDRGCSVVTANKGPLAFAASELLCLASCKGVSLLYESTVMDGAPVFNLARSALRACRILRLQGVINSTSNFVLGRIENGGSLSEAVQEARRLGFAEADPGYDLEGWDAAAKLCVLANTLMGAQLTPFEVQREGLSDIEPERVRGAVARHSHLKQVAELVKRQGSLEARVELRELADDHPLARVAGNGSMLRISTDLMGPISIIQEAPTVSDTAYGVINDLLEIQARSEIAGSVVND